MGVLAVDTRRESINLDSTPLSPVRKDSQATLTELTDNEKPQFTVNWSVKQKRGFKYVDSVQTDSHSEMEDKYFPTEFTPRNEFCSLNGDQLFIIADGHAGHKAASWFIERISKGVMKLLNVKCWSFESCSDRSQLTNGISDLFQRLDREYTVLKTRQFQRWKSNGSLPTERPDDDGCTMVLNIVRPGWVLNCNLGDSRTVIACPSISQKEWIPHFSSADHNMTHPQKIRNIIERGGSFINPIALKRIEVPIKTPGREYRELANARLCRIHSDEIANVGCSHRRTLNLTATLGDLLFKIEPAIISSVPDFSFIKLHNSESILIMATDGLWDHLTAHKAVVQNETIVEKVTQKISSVMEQSFLDESTLDSTTSNGILGALNQVCEDLVERENRIDSLFLENQIRYDDITVMIIHLDSF